MRRWMMRSYDYDDHAQKKKEEEEEEEDNEGKEPGLW